MGESYTPAGVSRRDFLKYCSWAAAVLGLGQAGVAQVASAVEELTQRPRVVWGSFQACTGCAIQLLQNREPTVQNLILQQISLDYQENVMAAAGKQAEELWAQVTGEKGFYFVAEGSVPTKIPEALMIGGRTAQEILRAAAPNAAGIIAIGTCASYGNVQASYPNPTGAVGIGEFLVQDMGAKAPAVINLPRCPGHGDDLVLTLVQVLVTGKLPELDDKGRPTFLYGQTIHDTCYRRGHFEAGEFVEKMGDVYTGEADYCLYKVGCKGPYTWAPCGKNYWNGNVSWCVHDAPCQGCAEPDFWDNFTPFFEQLRGVDQDGNHVPFETIGLAAGAVTVLGLGGYAVAQNARERRAGRDETDKRPSAGGGV